jgi:ABC-type taurine transport system ATPase subunit
VTFNAASQVTSISNLPSGWSTTNTATSIAVTHSVGSNPMMLSIYGQEGAGDNSLVNVTVGPAKYVAGSFQLNYNANTSPPTLFNITNITTTNFGTVSSGTSIVYVQFR